MGPDVRKTPDELGSAANAVRHRRLEESPHEHLLRDAVPRLRVPLLTVAPMEKITSVLAVVEDSTSGTTVLDKAVTLARVFGARVELLVTEACLAPELASRCSARAYDEVTPCGGLRHGEPLHDLLLRHIRERRPDVLIKARGGAHPLHSWNLHVNELAREAPLPVILAGMKPWSAAMRFAAAVDIAAPEASIEARAVLQAAGFLALGWHGRLDILYCEREERDERVRMERAVKLAQLVREYHVGVERLQVFDGAPEKRLPALIAARQYDVLVLGPDPPGGTLADATLGDVMLVHGGHAAPDQRHLPLSARADRARRSAAHPS
jgi:hypothetical protein